MYTTDCCAHNNAINKNCTALDGRYELDSLLAQQ